MISKLTNLIKRAILTIASKDDTDFQICQVSYLGKTKNINLVLPYGLFSNPKENGLVLTFNIGANEENIAGIPYNPYSRFKDLKKGEVVVGNPHTQTKVYFKENGDIDIESSGVVNINGASEPLVRGNALKDLFNAHTHTGNLGAPTSAPIVSMSSTELSTKNFTE